MTFTIQTAVRAPIAKVWQTFNSPAHIKQWNTAWNEFDAVYTRVVPEKAIDYRMSDGRKVYVEFVERADDVLVKETIETEDRHPYEQQRQDWQNILNDFGRHVEANP